MTRAAMALVGIACLAAEMLSNASVAAEEVGLPDLSGEFRGDLLTLVLAPHPRWPKTQYIGILSLGPEPKVQPVRASCDVVKGCHGTALEGTAANGRPFALKLVGGEMTLRWYDGPTLELKRMPAEN